MRAGSTGYRASTTRSHSGRAARGSRRPRSRRASCAAPSARSSSRCAPLPLSFQIPLVVVVVVALKLTLSLSLRRAGPLDPPLVPLGRLVRVRLAPRLHVREQLRHPAARGRQDGLGVRGRVQAGLCGRGRHVRAAVSRASEERAQGVVESLERCHHHHVAVSLSLSASQKNERESCFARSATRPARLAPPLRPRPSRAR